MKRFQLFVCALLITSFYCKAQSPETMLDPSFGKNGRVLYFDSTLIQDNTYRTETDKMVLQGDKIILAGNFVNGIRRILHADSNRVVRLNNDGSLDTTFGTKGIFTFAYPEFSSGSISGLGCQTDGKIVGLIHTGTYYEEHHNPTFVNGLFRLTADGAIDSTFGSNGFKFLNNQPQTLLVLPNSEIVVAAIKFFGHKRGYTLSKYTRNGGLVAVDSFQLPQHQSVGYSLRLRLDEKGKIVMACDQTTLNKINPYGISVLKFNTALQADSAFGVNGIATIKTDRNNFFGYYFFSDITLQKHGKTVMVITGDLNLKIKRIDSSGNNDISFGKKGTVVLPVEGYDRFYTAAVQTQNNNKILILNGAQSKQLTLLRLMPDGAVDSSFGENGISHIKFYIQGQLADAFGKDMILQRDGKILVCNDVWYSQFNRTDGSPSVVRYLPEKITSKTIVKSATLSSFKSATVNISISPNPVKDVLNIFSNNLSYKNISVINTSGVTVLKDAFAGKQHSITVSSLVAGVYYVTVVNNDGTSQTKKMIKQ